MSVANFVRILEKKSSINHDPGLSKCSGSTKQNNPYWSLKKNNFSSSHFFARFFKIKIKEEIE